MRGKGGKWDCPGPTRGTCISNGIENKSTIDKELHPFSETTVKHFLTTHEMQVVRELATEAVPSYRKWGTVRYNCEARAVFTSFLFHFPLFSVALLF